MSDPVPLNPLTPMSLLQFIGILSLLATVGLSFLSAILWLATKRRSWGRVMLVIPAVYLLALLIVGLLVPGVVVPAGSAQRFCGFYLDCHLSVRVTKVERGPSDWTVTLEVGNDARRVALTPIGLRVELLRKDSAAVRLVPAGGRLDSPIEAGGARSLTVAFAAPADGETPTLRVTDGYGVDRVIEGLLLGDDDALGRHRVVLGL